MVTSNERGKRKLREGRVVKDAMDKTIVVRVERRIRHPLYGKELRQISKIYVHDEDNQAHTGDRVRVMETRPVSRLKHWRLVDIVEKSE